MDKCPPKTEENIVVIFFTVNYTVPIHKKKRTFAKSPPFQPQVAASSTPSTYLSHSLNHHAPLPPGKTLETDLNALYPPISLPGTPTEAPRHPVVRRDVVALGRADSKTAAGEEDVAGGGNSGGGNAASRGEHRFAFAL